VTSGVPFANGAPNLTVDIPRFRHSRTITTWRSAGKRFQDGADADENHPRAGLQGAPCWAGKAVFPPNILGNRDGEVLEDPGSFKTKEESKLSVLEYILQPQLYPQLYGKMCPQGAHQLLSAARRQQRRLG